MQLVTKSILASALVALFSVASFAQTTEAVSADDVADITSYWVNNNQEELQAEFGDTSLSWGGYILSLGHEAEEPTSYSALFHAFSTDFTNLYGIQPQQASVDQLRSYYTQRKNDYGGELLLPTMAIWHNRPLLSIVPLPDRLDAYWKAADQAGDTYDFMASIDREDTLAFMGSYMGAFYGHPTNQKDLKNFWKKWMKRSANSAARQDIGALKKAMLLEILSHDAEYAVYELASKDLDLWPQLHQAPITDEEQAKVQEVLSAVCLEDDPTEDCARFINYANRYKYTDNVDSTVQTRISVVYYGGNWNAGIYDDLYFDSWLYHRRWRVRTTPLLWYWDSWHPYYYWADRYYYPYEYRWYAYPWYWHRPPVVIVRPGHHRPPVIHHGHRPHRPGDHGGIIPGFRPDHHRPGHGGTAGGRRPHHPNPGHGGGNGGVHNPGHGGNGNNPGHRPGNGGNGHNPGHGGNGHNPGHGGNGGVHNPGNGGNGHHPGGTIDNGRSRPSVTNVDPKVVRENPTAVSGHRDVTGVKGERVDRGGTGNTGHRPNPSTRSGSTPSTRINHGNVEREVIRQTTPPASSRRPGGSSSSSYGRPSGAENRPSHSTGGYGGSSRSTGSYNNSGRSSGGYSSPSRSSGSYGGPSRSSGSFGGSSRSSGGFSGGSHGGNSSGSHRGGSSGRRH